LRSRACCANLNEKMNNDSTGDVALILGPDFVGVSFCERFLQPQIDDMLKKSPDAHFIVRDVNQADRWAQHYLSMRNVAKSHVVVFVIAGEPPLHPELGFRVNDKMETTVERDKAMALSATHLIVKLPQFGSISSNVFIPFLIANHAEYQESDASKAPRDTDVICHVAHTIAEVSRENAEPIDKAFADCVSMLYDIFYSDEKPSARVLENLVAAVRAGNEDVL